MTKKKDSHKLVEVDIYEIAFVNNMGQMTTFPNCLVETLFAFRMEGLVKLQMGVTFGSSALGNFKVWQIRILILLNILDCFRNSYFLSCGSIT